MASSLATDAIVSTCSGLAMSRSGAGSAPPLFTAKGEL